MVSYLNVGSAWGVTTGNPKNFDTSKPLRHDRRRSNRHRTGNLCGRAVRSSCKADGKEKITVMPHELQTDIATKIISGQYDATLADSTVIGYTAAGSDGKIEQLGETF